MNTDQVKEIAVLRNRVECLEHDLKLALGPRQQNFHNLMMKFRLSRQLASILECLSSGYVVSAQELLEQIGSHASNEDDNNISVQISKFRKKIAPLILHNVWGEGWQLQRENLAAIKAVLDGPQ
jgi:DNA-binding response OmpR family regulator